MKLDDIKKSNGIKKLHVAVGLEKNQMILRNWISFISLRNMSLRFYKVSWYAIDWHEIWSLRFYTSWNDFHANF